jgi:hypothetical protein
VAAQEFGVERFPPIYDFRERVIGFDEAAALRADLEPLFFGHEHDLGHGFGEGGWIGGGNEDTSLPVVASGKNGFAGSCGVGGDYGQAGCRGFEDADGQALPE